MTEMPLLSEPMCFRCKKTPEQLDEYIEQARDETDDTGVKITPTQWMLREEGTWNPASGHFCCTNCYVAIGMPTAPYPGWKAP